MNERRITIESGSVAETIAFGRQIGARAVVGDVLVLVGMLGAGKTHLSKGIAVGLGLSDDRNVNSPTFVIVNEYVGRVPIIHMDAYRLSSSEDLEALGFAEMCDGHAVVLVEWGDRVRSAIPDTAVWIEFEVTGDRDRRLHLYGRDDTIVRLTGSA